MWYDLAIPSFSIQPKGKGLRSVILTFFVYTLPNTRAHQNLTNSDIFQDSNLATIFPFTCLCDRFVRA